MNDITIVEYRKMLSSINWAGEGMASPLDERRQAEKRAEAYMVAKQKGGEFKRLLDKTLRQQREIDMVTPKKIGRYSSGG